MVSDSISWCSLTGLSTTFSYAKLSRCWLRKNLQKKDCWKPYLDYENNVCKYESIRCRKKFLKNCLSTDIIPDFLKFRVPKTDVLSDQAVHSFQLKMLRSEISTAADTHHKTDQKRAASRKVLLKNRDNHLLPSVIFVLRNRVCNHAVNSERKLQRKLAKLSRSSKCDLVLIETVQKSATKWIIGSSLTYKERLIKLKILPLSFYFELHSLLLLCDLINNKYNIAIEKFIHFNNNNRTRQGAKCEIKLTK